MPILYTLGCFLNVSQLVTFYQRNGFYGISHTRPPHIQKLSKEIDNRCEKEAEIL